MKILITGATGFIGKNLAEELIKEGHETYALVRKTSHTDFLKSIGVKFVCGDITKKEIPESLSDNSFDAIYHCAGLVSAWDRKRLHQVNVIGSENICNLSVKLGVKKLIYLSSVSVVSGNENIPTTDYLPHKATTIYGKSKLEAEKKVIEFRKKGLNVAILRPGMVYGEGEPHFLGKLFFLLKYRLIPIVDGGKNKWHMVYIKNLVDALIMALKKDELFTGTFLVADDEILTVEEIFNILCKNIGAAAPVKLPDQCTRVFTKIPFLGEYFNFFLKSRIYDTSRLKSTGYKAKYRANAALAKTARHWLKSS